MITTDYLWKDGILLQKIGTNFLCKNFCQLLDKLLYNQNY